MCDYSKEIIENSRKSNKPWEPLYKFLINKCHCPHCQDTYKRIEATIKIRKLFRRKLKTVNNNLRILKSISDKEIDYRQKKWMLPLTDNINDLNTIFFILN